MRLLELHLDRFGHFTDRRVGFRPDAALTVIHGANETGKSTALAAVTDALFGIEHRSRYNFLHSHPDMRLGCTIVGADGRRFCFRRRKGNQNTLLDESDQAVSDDALAAFLGHVDRTLFLDAFGLDQRRLREGAERLIKGGGDIGESLLAAAPGLGNLVALRASLAAEADALFPIGRKVASRPFYMACDRYHEARRQVRERAVSVETVKAARLALEAAVERHGEVQASRRRHREESTRLARLKTALPRLDRIDQINAEKDELGPLPEVPADFVERCSDALDRHRTLEGELRRLEREMAGIEEDHRGVTVDDALIARKDEIEALGDARANFLKDQRDLPKREGEIATLGRQLDGIAARLGLGSRQAVLDRQPGDAELARCRGLVSRRRTLVDRRQERSQDRERIRSQIEAVEAERKALGHVADPAPLRHALDQVRDLSARTDTRDQARRALAALDRKIGEALGRLLVPVASVDALAVLSVPDVSAVDAAATRFDALDRRAEKLREEIERFGEQSADVERRLSSLVEEGALATPEAVNEARTARNARWQGLRRRLLGDEVAHEVDPAVEVPAYEAAVAEADTLADLRIAEADRVARFQHLSREHAEALSRLESARKRQKALVEEREAARRDWAAPWQAAGLEPADPKAMRGWIDARAQILDMREDHEAQQAYLDRSEAAVAAQLDRLGDLAGGLGLASRKSDPAALLDAVRQAVEDQSGRFQDARLLSQKIDGLNQQRESIERDLAGFAAAEDAWRAEWAEVVPALGIRVTAEPDEADAVLAAWAGVPQIAASLADLAHRVERMREDCAGFEAGVRTLCEAVAPDLVAVPPASAIATLRDRLQAAHMAAARHAELARRHAEHDKRRSEVERDRDETSAIVSRLVQDAALPDAGALPGLLERLRRHDALAADLADEEGALAQVSDGFTEDQLRAELATIGADALIVRLRELSEEEAVLDDRLGEVVREEERAAAGLEEVEAREGAAAAAQDSQTALAGIADIVERWTVLAAAEQLLGTAIETYRSRHQSPVLERAGEAFAIATGGAFAGLSIAYGEDDSPRIVAQRANGSQVPLEGLSEGTADQLYLALRVATIEDFARRATPLPFIADDLFVSFDDARTEAALRLLKDFAESTQVIVFTHHAHVVTCAHRAVGEGLQVVEL